MLSFCNGRESWVAAAGEESSLDFYNPTATGADRIGGATLVGSNALIRRTALVSCGGYHPGLAEDLATSLALHAAGWRSAYVAEPLAPGFTPPDLGAWFTQQLKWARGVFEVLLTDYPRHFRRLSWGQRLSYAVRMTYYWLGPVVGIHLLFTVSVLLFPHVIRPATYQSYLAHLAPLAVATLLTRHVALRVTRHPIIPATSFIRAMTLVYGTWPVYTIAWIMSLLRHPARLSTDAEIAERERISAAMVSSAPLDRPSTPRVPGSFPSFHGRGTHCRHCLFRNRPVYPRPYSLHSRSIQGATRTRTRRGRDPPKDNRAAV